MAQTCIGVFNPTTSAWACVETGQAAQYSFLGGAMTADGFFIPSTRGGRLRASRAVGQ